MTRLKSLDLSGFKSIQRIDELAFSPLNVLIGPNGAGKTNLLSFFRLLNFAMSGGLREFVSRSGAANRLLHFGVARTHEITAKVTIESPQGLNYYRVRLAHAAGDVLVFLEETVQFQRIGAPEPRFASLGVGHTESLLESQATENNPTARFIKHQLDLWRHYHFHDTSDTALIKQAADVRDNRYLRTNAGNLAAYLFAMKERAPDNYWQIRDTVRRVAPFFDDFRLEPDRLNPNTIRLEWKEAGSPDVFDAYYFSDGTLRFICLATLLLQPEPPLLVVIDEPELGLHPAALTLLASMLRSASARTQLVLSTQSATLIDELTPEDVIVVERASGSSTFRRLAPTELDQWLDEYSLGEVWQKNVIGGRP